MQTIANSVNILVLGLMSCIGMVNVLLNVYHPFNWKAIQITMSVFLLVQAIYFYTQMDHVSPTVQSLTPLILTRLPTFVIIPVTWDHII